MADNSSENVGNANENVDKVDQTAKDPNEKVSFYGHKVSRARLEPLVEFYKADHALTDEDRKVMVADLEKIRNTSVMWGMLDASLAFFIPTMYRRYVNSKALQQTGTVKIPVRRFIYRPILSAMIGSLTYFTSILYNANKQINAQVDKLAVAVPAGDSDVESDGLDRRLKVWKSMTPSQITFYYIYYWKTSQDPSFVLKDPLKMTENPHEVHFIPPAVKKRLWGGFFSEEPEKPLPHWEQIRKENGFVEGTTDGGLEVTEAVTVAEAIPQSDQAEKPQSAWEKLRKGK